MEKPWGVKVKRVSSEKPIFADMEVRLYSVQVTKKPGRFTHPELHKAIEKIKGSHRLKEGKQIGYVGIQIYSLPKQVVIRGFYPFSTKASEKPEYPFEGHGVALFVRKQVVDDLMPEFKGFKIRSSLHVSDSMAPHLTEHDISPNKLYSLPEYKTLIEAAIAKARKL